MRAGSIACPLAGCGNPDATVKETAAGTLHLTCHRCEMSAYARADTKAARLVRAAFVPDDEPGSGPAPANPPAPAPKPARKPTTLLG